MKYDYEIEIFMMKKMMSKIPTEITVENCKKYNKKMMEKFVELYEKYPVNCKYSRYFHQILCYEVYDNFCTKYKIDFTPILLGNQLFTSIENYVKNLKIVINNYEEFWNLNQKIHRTIFNKLLKDLKNLVDDIINIWTIDCIKYEEFYKLIPDNHLQIAVIKIPPKFVMNSFKFEEGIDIIFNYDTRIQGF